MSDADLCLRDPIILAASRRACSFYIAKACTKRIRACRLCILTRRYGTACDKLKQGASYKPGARACTRLHGH